LKLTLKFKGEICNIYINYAYIYSYVSYIEVRGPQAEVVIHFQCTLTF
jgi:hypothetical protein